MSNLSLHAYYEQSCCKPNYFKQHLQMYWYQCLFAKWTMIIEHMLCRLPYTDGGHMCITTWSYGP